MMGRTKCAYKCRKCGKEYKSFFPIERDWLCYDCNPIKFKK